MKIFFKQTLRFSFVVDNRFLFFGVPVAVAEPEHLLQIHFQLHLRKRFSSFLVLVLLLWSSF